MKQNDSEFKQEAIRLALTSSQPIVQTAQDPGVKEITLYNLIRSTKDKQSSAKVNDEPEVNLADELNR